MKRTLIFSALCLLTAMSCRTNDNAESVAKTVQITEALKTFNATIRTVLKAQDDAQSPKRSPMELSDYKKKMLLPLAMELVVSSGVTKEEVVKITNNDMNEIIDWAVEVYDNGGKAVNHIIKTN